MTNTKEWQEIDIDDLAYDHEKTMDVAFGEYYEANQTKLEYITPDIIATDERLRKLVQLVIDDAITYKATDIQISHLNSSIGLVKYRVGGSLYPYRRLHGASVQGIGYVIKKLANIGVTQYGKRLDGGFTHTYKGETYRLRTNLMPTIYGESISLRIIYNDQLDTSVDSLGLPDRVLSTFKEVLGLQEGLIILTGATGSGKTTTMYTGINHIMAENLNTKNIITIEDPVEYLIPYAIQSQVNNDIGYTFAEALKSAFRQDPDVILIGEINDAITAQTAVRASTSGHLVFSTLHTNSVLTVPLALADYGVTPYSLNSSLTLVLNQKLPSKLCDHCKIRKIVTSEQLQWIDQLGEGKIVNVYEPQGCEYCDYRGYKGKVLVISMLDANGVYKRIVGDGTRPIDTIEEELKNTDRSNYYSLGTDIYRHLKAGNIDMMTAMALMREEVS